MSRTIISPKALSAIAPLIVTLAAAPALAQPAASSGTTPDQQAMVHTSVDRSMLGMPVIQPDGTLVGWLTGARMTGVDPNLVLIERPSRGSDKDVLAINGTPLRVRGDVIVLDTQVTARPATYDPDGPVID